MSVAILSAKTGNGHNAVMNTIAEVFFMRNYKEIFIYPSFYEDNLISNKILSDFYNFLIATSNIELCEKFSELSAIGGYDLSDDIYSGSRDNILKLINKPGLEAIISTSHSINNNIIRALKESGLYKKIPFYIVVTDPFNPISVGFDVVGATKYFCTTEEVRKILIEGGVESKLIETIGYPVQDKFCLEYSENKKNDICNKMQLSADKKTIMINSGASGSIHYFKILKSLLNSTNDYQIIFICGKNKALYSIANSYLKRNNISEVKVYGFVDNMEEILQVCDVVVTKAGANTFFESLYSGVPIIVDGVNGFLYQERGVKNYLIEREVGFILEHEHQLEELLDMMFNNELLDKKFKANIKNLNLQNGAIKIVDTVLNDLYGRSNYDKK